MQKFKTKAVTVEAMQFRRDGNGNQILQWAGCWFGSTSNAVTFGGDETGSTLKIKTIGGQVLIAQDGDYIVKRGDGDFYPSSKVAFESLFEPA